MRRTTNFYKGGIYHVQNRGVFSTDIFAHDGYSDYFQEKAVEFATKFEMGIVGIIVMSDHYHIVLRQEGDQSVSDYMKQLGFHYSRWYNRQQGNKGTIYEGRFRAVEITSTEQLWRTILYVFLIPVFARIVTHPRLYRYSNYRQVVEGASLTNAHARLLAEVLADRTKFVQYINEGIQSALKKLEHEMSLSGIPP